MKKTSYIVVLITLFYINSIKAENFLSGSFIINMGISNQTVGNGLKPYGMIYDLIKNYNVPVKWVINPNKTKDGEDFLYRDTSYKGGTFIIPFQSINSDVKTRITYWRNQGVIGLYTSTNLNVNVTHTLTTYPRWTLNNANKSISESFFDLAGIPSNAYNFSTPAQLDACNDIFVMPHADPNWNTHGNLYNWNRNSLGAIWAGCHAVSVMEGLINPNNNSQRLNFLSTQGLINFNTHDNKGISNQPLSYLFNQSNYNGSSISASASDPVFQMIGAEDDAHTNGSERVYIPVNTSGSGWRNTTKIGAFDNNHSNVNSYPHGPAAMTLYGRGFGLNTSGNVMYQSGHNIASSKIGNNDVTSSHHVAALRQFFNFSLISAMDKVPTINSYNISSLIGNNQSYNFSINASSPVNATMTYLWTSTIGGTFSNPTSASTTYTTPSDFSTEDGLIICEITDQCGRKIFISQPVNTFTISILPIKLSNFIVNPLNQSIELKWICHQSENLIQTEIFRSNDGFSYERIATLYSDNNNSINNNQFIDENVQLLNVDKFYYKLKFIELNEESSWSPTKFILNENFNNTITIYPNPSSDVIHIKTTLEIDKTQIIDMFGRVLSEELFSHNINISQIPNGNYILRIMSKDIVRTKNIIIQH
ncbi:MAG: T9SS type A sorting domain-containing protein [Bacteroidota bacterium]|nr:T9SS type A sorting domain-containing protein [Bacteroidota bacterium]